MERQPIEVWDMLVRTDLFPGYLTQVLQENGAVDVLVKQFQEAIESTRLFLMRESILRKTVEELNLLVERHQVYFVTQLNTVSELLARKDANKTHLVLYELAANSLTTIIQFLSTSFTAYFDYTKVVPAFILSRFEKNIQPAVRLVKKRLTETAGDKDRFSTVFEFVEKAVVASVNGQVSFHIIKYYKHLIEELSRWEPGDNKMTLFEPLVEKLIMLGFNDTQFVYFLLADLKRMIGEKDGDEQLLFCKECAKKVAQLLEEGSEYMFSDKPAAKDTLLEFLAQEIGFLNWLPKRENNGNGTAEKIQTSLTVPVLALYIRLFKEAGIFTNANHSELIRAVSSIFTIGRNTDISKNHLHSKFYAIDENTRRVTFDQLMKMAQLVKKIG